MCLLVSSDLSLGRQAVILSHTVFLACAEAGLQEFTAVFDVVDEPHWLKCLILRFSVIIASKLDDKTEPSSNTESNQAVARQKVKEMAPSMPLGSSGGHSISTPPSQQIAPGTAGLPANLSHASERGWLPPALLPRKGDSLGKMKQPKKSMKQRGSKQQAVPPAEQPQSSNDSDSWDIPAGQKGGPAMAHSSCSEEGDELDVSSVTPPSVLERPDEGDSQSAASRAWSHGPHKAGAMANGTGLSLIIELIY